jgi:hypothetical protein
MSEDNADQRKPSPISDDGGPAAAVDPTADETIGYKKPPTTSRWKKGCPSPNPRGRPKKAIRAFSARQLNTDILSVANEEIEILVKGRVTRVSRHEALIMRIYADALKGDPYAVKVALKIGEDAANRRAQYSDLYKWLEEIEQIAIDAHSDKDIAEFNYFRDILRKRTQRK